MPFVPTPAAFFSAAGGVVIRRTFSAGAGQQGLESAAQFSTGCIVIGGTVCRAASFIQVVILHTIPESRRWNPPHSLRRAGLLSAAQFRCGVHRGAKKWLLSGAQFGLFSAGGRLLSTAQFARWVKFGYCYRQHISEFRLLSKRVRTGLLSSAHFRQWGCYRRHISEKIHRTAHSRYCYSRHISLFPGQSGCYPAHNSQKSVFLRRVLPWVVSLRTVCPAGAGVVIDGTIQGFFSTGCYSAHISPRQDFSIRPVGMLRTFLTFPFFAPEGCYTRHFLKIPQKFLCRHFPAKKLFYRCYAPHIVAFYTFVLECCAQHRCNTAHICVGIFDIAILLF